MFQVIHRPDGLTPPAYSLSQIPLTVVFVPRSSLEPFLRYITQPGLHYAIYNMKENLHRGYSSHDDAVK